MNPKVHRLTTQMIGAPLTAHAAVFAFAAVGAVDGYAAEFFRYLLQHDFQSFGYTAPWCAFVNATAATAHIGI